MLPSSQLELSIELKFVFKCLIKSTEVWRKLHCGSQEPARSISRTSRLVWFRQQSYYNHKRWPFELVQNEWKIWGVGTEQRCVYAPLYLACFSKFSSIRRQLRLQKALFFEEDVSDALLGEDVTLLLSPLLMLMKILKVFVCTFILIWIVV